MLTQDPCKIELSGCWVTMPAFSGMSGELLREDNTIVGRTRATTNSGEHKESLEDCSVVTVSPASGVLGTQQRF